MIATEDCAGELEAGWPASCQDLAAAVSAKGDASDISAKLPHFNKLLRLTFVCSRRICPSAKSSNLDKSPLRVVKKLTSARIESLEPGFAYY